MVTKPNLQIKSKNFRKIKIKKQPDKRQVSSQILVKRVVHHPRIVPYPYSQLNIPRRLVCQSYLIGHRPPTLSHHPTTDPLPFSHEIQVPEVYILTNVSHA